MTEQIYRRLCELLGYTHDQGYLRRPDNTIAAVYVPSEKRWIVDLTSVDVMILGMEEGRRPLGDGENINVILANIGDTARRLFPQPR